MISLVLIFFLVIVCFLFRKVRTLCLFFIFFLSPAIYVFDKDCSVYNYLDGISITILPISFIDVLYELFSGHYGMSFYGHTFWYYDSYFILQIYSILFFFIPYFSLKKETLIISKSYYENIYLGLLLLSISTLFISFYYYNISFISRSNLTTNVEYSKKYNTLLIAYLIVYFLILIGYKIYTRRKNINIKINIFTILLLVSFPIISVSENYRAILSCGSDDVFNNERIVTINALITALPKTIVSFIQDSEQERFTSFLNIKFYSLFQIIVVLFLFPSLLISKEEKYV